MMNLVDVLFTATRLNMKIDDRILVRPLDNGIWYEGKVASIYDGMAMVKYFNEDGDLKRFSFILEGYKDDRQVLHLSPVY